MKRFLFWTGGSYVNATCKECDFRIQFGALEDGGVVQEACETHDCLVDGD